MKNRSWYGMLAAIVLIGIGRDTALWKELCQNHYKNEETRGSEGSSQQNKMMIQKKSNEKVSMISMISQTETVSKVEESSSAVRDRNAEEVKETAVQKIKMPTESVLEEKIICIDAGHQRKGNSGQEPIGPESSQTKAKVSLGTKGIATCKYEYELNLEVALKLKEALLIKKAVVYMVRETNEVDISNLQRAQLANKVKADLSLRIHADGSDNSEVNGFSILVPGGSYVDEEICLRSRNIAECIEKQLTDSLPNKPRGIVTREDLTGFNWCEVPAVLVEMGFMSNPEEDLRMSKETFQETLVQGLIKGLETYYSEKQE